MNVLLTGLTGFSGRAVAQKLLKGGDIHVTGLVRKPDSSLPEEIKQIVLSDLSIIASRSEDGCHKKSDPGLTEPPFCQEYEQLQHVLSHTDVIIHTAAISAVGQCDDIEVRKINTDATIALAELAAASGVKRFVFLSSIKVNGESSGDACPGFLRLKKISDSGRFFKETDFPEPKDIYAESKLLAEQGLMKISKTTGLEVVLIRPPLVYGPGVKGNFAKIFNLVKTRKFIPLGKIYNKRAFIGLTNLVSVIELCLEHPKAANQLFLVSDAWDVSTSELIQQMANALAKKVVLIPIPVTALSLLALIIGKQSITERLFASLRVDNSKVQNLLGWKPICSMQQELEYMVQSDSEEAIKTDGK